VNESASDPRDEEGIGDSEFDSVIEGSLGSFQHGVQLGCLGDSSWETIKDESDISASPDLSFSKVMSEKRRGIRGRRTYPSLHS